MKLFICYNPHTIVTSLIPMLTLQFRGDREKMERGRWCPAREGSAATTNGGEGEGLAAGQWGRGGGESCGV